MNDDCASTTQEERERQAKKEKRNAYARNRRKNNPLVAEAERIAAREYRRKQKEKDPGYLEKHRKYMREYARERRKNDPAFLEAARTRTREYMRNRFKNKPELAEKERMRWIEYRKQNLEKLRAMWRDFARKRHKEMSEDEKGAAREYIREYVKKRRRVDPAFAIALALRTRLRDALRYQSTNKKDKTLGLVGCSKEQLMAHLENQFQKGMTWANRGKVWHIDHIVPCAAFDLTTEEGQRACFHFSNLRPLWAVENIKKQAKIITCQPELPLLLV